MSDKEMIAERLVLVNQDGIARIGNGGEIGLNRLTICDDNGMIFMDLRLEHGKPIFKLFDNGSVRACLGVLNDEVGFFLCDGHGVARMQLAVSAKGDSDLTFLDADGKTRATIIMNQNEGGAVILSDEKGKAVVGMMNGKGGPDVVLFDEKRKRYWEAVKSKPERKPRRKAKRSPVRLGRRPASKGRKGGAK